MPDGSTFPAGERLQAVTLPDTPNLRDGYHFSVAPTPSHSAGAAGQQSLSVFRTLPLSTSVPAYGIPIRGVSELAVAKPNADRDQIVHARLAALKIATANLAMHLESKWRDGLFRQLDQLIDPTEWDFSDDLPSVASYKTFLRMMIFLGKVKRPALGATSDGNIIAGWMSGKDRLTIECAPADEVRWSVVKWIDGRREPAAGRTLVARLPSRLEPYDSSDWFGLGG